MFVLTRLIWILALFPWFDYAIRGLFPSALASTWDESYLILILISLYFYQCTREEPQFRSQMIPASIKLPFFALIIFTVGSIVINTVPLSVSVDAARVVFQPMLFLLLTHFMLDREKLLDSFINILIVSTVVMALYGILQYVFQLELPRFQQKPDAQYRIISIFSNPNALGAYFNMVLAFLLALFLHTKGIAKKLLYLLAIVPIFLALLLTFSRGAWIAFFIMAIYAFWVANRKWLLALPLIIVALPFAMPQSVVDRFSYLFDPEYYLMSSEYGRISFWTDAIKKTFEKPIFGHGLGMYGDSVPLRHNIPFSTWVDNHYLKLSAEIGIFGLVAILTMLFMLLVLARKLYRTAESPKFRAYALGLSGVFLAMIVQNFTASIWEVLTDAVMFYAFVGMLFALRWRQHLLSQGKEPDEQ